MGKEEKNRINTENNIFENSDIEMEEEIEDEEPDRITKKIFNSTLNRRFFEECVNKLHPVHPWRMLKYAPSKWKPFEILHTTEIKNINTTQWNRYQKLFYNFNRFAEKYKNKCPICENKINSDINAIEKHLLIECNEIKHIREKF